MSREEIYNIVHDFLIDELEIDEKKISPNARLKEDLSIDSLDFVDIVVIVQRTFGFKMRPNDMANIKTLSEFCDFIEKNLKKSDEAD